MEKTGITNKHLIIKKVIENFLISYYKSNL